MFSCYYLVPFFSGQISPSLSLFLQLHLKHMEFPRLGGELELQQLAYATATAMQDPSCICNLCYSLEQHQILSSLSEARYWSHIPMDTSCVLSPLSHNRNSDKYSSCFISFFFFFFFFFLSFQGCTHSLWKFPGQGLNYNYTCQPMLQTQQYQIQASSATCILQLMATLDP